MAKRHYQVRWNKYKPETCLEQARQKAMAIEKTTPILGWAYRLEDVSYAGVPDEYGDPTPSNVYVEVTAYHIVGFTPKGFWIWDRFEGRKRFVLSEARKAFCRILVSHAGEDLVARKRKQIRIYNARIKAAEEAILYV